MEHRLTDSIVASLTPDHIVTASYRRSLGAPDDSKPRVQAG